MGWTPEQERAIRARGTNLLLSAAAGSGKTTVLVERVLSLIEEGTDVDRMLIVTFSRAAAADMKAKLTARLARRVRENPSVAEQMEKVERASVCTLHAYCIDVLRSHFEAADVDPSFRVLDDAQTGQLKAQAMQQMLERTLAEGSEDLERLLYGRDVKTLSQMVLALYEFSQNRPDPKEWLENALVGIGKKGGGIWADEIVRYAKREVREATAFTRCALKSAREGCPVYVGALESDLENLEEIIKAQNYETLRRAVREYKQTRLASFRKGKEDEQALYAAQQVKELRKTQKACMERAAEAMPDLEDALSDIRDLLPAGRALNDLVAAFSEELWSLKQDRSALTFSDLEHAALKALRDDRVAQAQRRRFDYVFVDEYQDVSDLQEAIVRRVAGDGNLFMVGDVKQSIYRFRQAEPGLFIEKYLNYGQENGGRLISLNRNFRSRESVLDLVNRVFERAMSGQDAELEYDEAARLNPGASYEGNAPKTEVFVLTGDVGENDKTEEEAELTLAQQEGSLVADRILQILGTPFFDTKAGAVRGIRPRDIAVLSRTKNGLTACELMLRNAGIPCYMDTTEGYFDALEVRTMLCLMQTVENRRRDYPLLAALRSPVGGFTSTQLALIRKAHPEGAYYEAVRAQMEKTEPLSDKLRAFEEKLTRWRALSRALPLSEWINLVLNESGYYAYAGGMAGGIARQGNLDLLLAYASQFESAQGGGLTGFLDYVTEINRTGGDMSPAHVLGEGDDVVRLMTAHKSKGLEFPVVFAVQMGRTLLSGGKGVSEPMCHRALGAGLYCNDQSLGTRRDTISRKAIKCIQKREALEEEKRILYVLLTRAMDRLILIGTEKSQESALLRWNIMRSDPEIRPETYLDMIVPALNDRERLTFLSARQTVRQEIPEKEQKTEKEEEIRKIREALTWRYPYEGEELAPLKLTASGLTREVIGPASAPAAARRPRFMSDRAMTATEHGTLVHAALSGLNLEKLRRCTNFKAEIEGQMEEMYERNLLTSRISSGPICAFFARDIGQRLLASDTVRREWPFNMRMTAREALNIDSDADVVIQGVIDCCFMENGQWVLMDYKTDRVQDEEIMNRYRGQVEIYRKALERITGIPVGETLLCLVGMGYEISVP